MKRYGPSDARLWALVTATVRPLPGRSPPRAPETTAPAVPSGASAAAVPRRQAPERVSRPAARALGPPQPIEPNRLRRIDKAREAAPTIDLHGLDQDRAREVLTRFLLAAAAGGERTVLVITGKGALGDGVLRRRTPEWLALPPLRPLVAGVSEAHRSRGGAGALYVALKRQAR
jgi:DNA-nicking Smr family endonuclease